MHWRPHRIKACPDTCPFPQVVHVGSADFLLPIGSLPPRFTKLPFRIDVQPGKEKANAQLLNQVDDGLKFGSHGAGDQSGSVPVPQISIDVRMQLPPPLAPVTWLA